MAAPVGGQILSEVLPYLEINKKLDEEEQQTSVEVPDVRNKTIKEATQILKENGLDINVNIDGEFDKENTIVTEQLPKLELKTKRGKKTDI